MFGKNNYVRMFLMEVFLNWALVTLLLFWIDW